MPTYQYACTECGGQIEAIQKFSDDPLTVHEACGGKLRKVFSPVGIVFKGSGFYRTDSRSGASQAASSSNSPAASDAGPASSSSSSDKSSSAETSSPAGGDKAAKAAPASSGTAAKASEKVA